MIEVDLHRQEASQLEKYEVAAAAGCIVAAIASVLAFVERGLITSCPARTFSTEGFLE
jgi:hypothetical protein